MHKLSDCPVDKNKCRDYMSTLYQLRFYIHELSHIMFDTQVSSRYYKPETNEEYESRYLQLLEHVKRIDTRLSFLYSDLYFYDRLFIDPDRLHINKGNISRAFILTAIERTMSFLNGEYNTKFLHFNINIDDAFKDIENDMHCFEHILYKIVEFAIYQSHFGTNIKITIGQAEDKKCKIETEIYGVKTDTGQNSVQKLVTILGGSEKHSCIKMFDYNVPIIAMMHNNIRQLKNFDHPLMKLLRKYITYNHAFIQYENETYVNKNIVNEQLFTDGKIDDRLIKNYIHSVYNHDKKELKSHTYKTLYEVFF